MRRTLPLLITVFLCATSARAERYLVLNSFYAPPVSDAEISRLGGAVVSRLYDRIEIDLSPKAVEELQANIAVAYVQAVDAPQPEAGQPSPAPKPVKHAAIAEFAPPTWFSGTYQYDGSGNIIGIGTATSAASDGSTNAYTYDLNSRLHTWTLTSGPNPRSEQYGYDPYGNLTSVQVGNITTAIGVDATTNRLTNRDYTSSGPGNLVDPYSGESLSYDAFNMVTSLTTAGGTTKYIYTAEDERIGALRGDTSTWTWSIRGADGEILRQYSSSESSSNTPWLWLEDYVYRDGPLLAAVRAPELGGRRHFHLDHLGTSRLITADDGSQIAQHDYTPWGTEVTSPCQEANQGYDRNELRVFTGHERDYRAACNDANVLDYMRARYFNDNLGRFVSVDPEIDEDTALRIPQRWNRYSYALNNPTKYFDRNGKSIALAIPAVVTVAVVTAAVFFHEYEMSANPTYRQAMTDIGNNLVSWMSRQTGRQRDTGLIGVSDEELQRLYDTATGVDRIRYAREQKARRLRNKNKPRGGAPQPKKPPARNSGGSQGQSGGSNQEEFFLGEFAETLWDGGDNDSYTAYVGGNGRFSNATSDWLALDILLDSMDSLDSFWESVPKQ